MRAITIITFPIRINLTLSTEKFNSMNSKTLLILLVLTFYSVLSFGQDSTYVDNFDTLASQTSYDDYPVHMSPSLIDLIDRDVKIKAKDHKTNGYRIQLYYGNREEAVKLKAEYQTLLKSERVYVEYEQPYFKTKIGDFRTELEAERYMRALGEKCDGCFVVADEIEFPALIPESSLPQLPDTPQ